MPQIKKNKKLIKENKRLLKEVSPNRSSCPLQNISKSIKRKIDNSVLTYACKRLKVPSNLMQGAVVSVVVSDRMSPKSGDICDSSSLFSWDKDGDGSGSSFPLVI